MGENCSAGFPRHYLLPNPCCPCVYRWTSSRRQTPLLLLRSRLCRRGCCVYYPPPRSDNFCLHNPAWCCPHCIRPRPPVLLRNSNRCCHQHHPKLPLNPHPRHQRRSRRDAHQLQHKCGLNRTLPQTLHHRQNREASNLPHRTLSCSHGDFCLHLQTVRSTRQCHPHADSGCDWGRNLLLPPLQNR